MLLYADDGAIIDTEQYGSKGYFEESKYWSCYAWGLKYRDFTFVDHIQIVFPKNGKYYLARISAENKSLCVNLMTSKHAVAWLLINNHRNLPEDLKAAAKSML